MNCGNCGAPHGPDDVFCESCGLDFASGALPDPVPGPAVTSIGGGAPPALAATQVVGVVTVSCDADHHRRMDADGVLTFPDPPPAPAVVPARTAAVLVGRAKPARGVHPDIDLGDGPHEDPAASTRHAVLERRGDGSWWVTDLDSTNGTWVGDTVDPIAPGSPVQVPPGTPVFVGAWTRLDITDPPPAVA